MFKYIIPALFLLATPVVAEEWDRAHMNKQVDDTLFNISNHCSGTLISTKYRLVVTNYHCVTDLFQTVEEEKVDEETGEVKKVKKRKLLPLDVFQSKDDTVSTKYRAKVEGYDRKNDLALLKVQSEKFPANAEVKLAPDNWCDRGMPAWAVGNPIMLEASVTKGVISHCDRKADDERGFEEERLVQVDVPIAGGSSGGGLFNYRGELVGVTNSGYRGTSHNFAVPVELVKKLLKEKGYESIYNPAAKDKATNEAEKKKTPVIVGPR